MVYSTRKLMIIHKVEKKRAFHSDLGNVNHITMILFAEIKMLRTRW